MFEKPPFSEVDVRELPAYEFHPDRIVIDDPVWGRAEIGNEPGDEIFLQLVDVPLVRRSMGIEQLTLGSETATMPSTTQFSRWEHMWGGVLLTRHLLEGAYVTPAEKITYQLRAFVSDLGHTAYSHLGDWIFQGVGGTEDQHDEELHRVLEVGGVNDVLRRNGYDPEDIAFPSVSDFVECPAPDLCVDRVDYAAREIKRWLDTDLTVHYAATPETFSLREGQIVMKDRQHATSFAKACLLLATEHWSEPVHRLQLRLQEALVKDVLQQDEPYITSLSTYDVSDFHPRDLLYTVDSDIDLEMLRWGMLASYLKPIMRDIGAYKRRIFSVQRREQLATFLRTDTDEYPHPLEHYGIYAQRHGKLPLLPPHVTIEPVDIPEDIPDFSTNPHTTDVFLRPLKPRRVDPLFLDDQGNVRRLSEADTNFASLLEQQAEVMAQAYVARIHLNTETKHLIEGQAGENDRLWGQALGRKRMPDDVFRDLLHNSAMHSVMSNLVELKWLR